MNVNETKYVFSLQSSFVHSFCLSYMCQINTHGNSYWELAARACVCAEESLWEEAGEKLARYDLKFNSNVSGLEKHTKLKRYSFDRRLRLTAFVFYTNF